MNMLKISKAIFRSLLSSRSLCVVVVALMVLCTLPVFRSAAGIDGRVEYLESGITRVEQELSASYADALVNAGGGRCLYLFIKHARASVPSCRGTSYLGTALSPTSVSADIGWRVHLL